MRVWDSAVRGPVAVACGVAECARSVIETPNGGLDHLKPSFCFRCDSWACCYTEAEDDGDHSVGNSWVVVGRSGSGGSLGSQVSGSSGGSVKYLTCVRVSANSLKHHMKT